MRSPGSWPPRDRKSKDRLTTILVAPLMSCSARLPVYTIIIAVLIPGAFAWQKAGLILGLYLVGIFGAFAMAWLFKKLCCAANAGFIMECRRIVCPFLKM